MPKLKVNDTVRILAYPPDAPNGEGRIDSINLDRDKPYWVSNINQPFAGTISGWFSDEEIEKK